MKRSPLGDRYERFAVVVAREPDLEAWQLAERFGLTPVQAWNAKYDVLRLRPLREAKRERRP